MTQPKFGGWKKISVEKHPSAQVKHLEVTFNFGVIQLLQQVLSNIWFLGFGGGFSFQVRAATAKATATPATSLQGKNHYLQHAVLEPSSSWMVDAPLYEHQAPKIYGAPSSPGCSLFHFGVAESKLQVTLPRGGPCVHATNTYVTCGPPFPSVPLTTAYSHT